MLLRIVGAVAAICVLGVVFSGCGQSDGSSSAETSCEFPLTGTVDAAAAITDEFGIATYRYSVTVDQYRVELLRADGSVIGTFTADVDTSINPMRSPGAAAIAGPIDVTMVLASGATANMKVSSRALHNPIGGEPHPTDPTKAIKYVNEALQTIELSTDKGSLKLLSNYFDPAAVDSRRRLLVPKSESDAIPSVGRDAKLLEPPERENGLPSLVEYHALDTVDNSTVVTNESEIATFASETGIDAWANDPVVSLMLLTYYDPTWAEAVARRIVFCSRGESGLADFDRAIAESASGQLQQKAAFDCLKAVGAVMGSWKLLGTGGAALLAGTFEIPIVGWAAAGLTVVGAGAVSLIYLVRCACTDDGGFVWCSKCDATRCNSYCKFSSPLQCIQAGNTITGECMIFRSRFEIGDTLQCQCTTNLINNSDENKGACNANDPHVDTWDGLAYSPQVAGEFIAAESVAGEELMLQVRQEPYSSAVCPWISVNTAMATKMNGASVFIDGRTSEVRVDNVVVDVRPGEGVGFSDGTAIERLNDDTFYLYHQGGVKVGVRTGEMMNVGVVASADRSGEFQGMLGTLDDDKTNELALRNGTVLEYPVPWRDVVTTYADSWRIDPIESLFYYEPGEATDTFDVANFPISPASVDDLPTETRAAAEAVCLEAGVTGSIGLNDCILDVGCTNLDELAQFHLDRSDERVPVSNAVDLTAWSTEGPADADGWEFPGSGTDAPNDDGAFTEINLTPSLLVSDRPYGDVIVSADVNNGSDTSEGMVGFLFQYERPLTENADPEEEYDALLLAWTGTDPDAFAGESVPSGWTLARLSGEISGNAIAASFFAQQSSPSYQVLTTSHGAGLGWENRIGFRLKLVYTSERIEVAVRNLSTSTSTVQFAAQSSTLGEEFGPGRIALITLGNNLTRFVNVAIAPLQ